MEGDFITSVIISVIVICMMSVGGMFIVRQFATAYNKNLPANTLESQTTFNDMTNMTSQISENINEAGSEDSTADAKIITTGWNSLKLTMKSPAILFSFLTNLSTGFSLTFGGVDFFGTLMLIFVVLFFITLVYMIFFGRA